MKEELKILEEFEKDSKWLADNYGKVKEKYVNKFIAVKNKQVIDNDDDFHKLIKRLRDKGEDLRRVVIEFVPPEDVVLVL